MAAEFLPLCDLLFNVVSLAAYFCDVVFDVLVIYTIYVRQGVSVLFVQCLLTIIISMSIIQMVSFHWWRAKLKNPSLSSAAATNSNNLMRHHLIILIHLFQLGLLWRYARLLMPIRIDNVKLYVRDLCILRLLHSFLQATPMLLIQLNLLATTTTATDDDKALSLGKPPNDLITVSASLSLFSVCWSLASFSKHVRDYDRLILTWPGVVSQLLWRCGTVTARFVALSAYAWSYRYWIGLVVVLHWSCVFLWLVSPRSPYHGEKLTKLWLCLLVSGVYVVAYVNLQGRDHKRTMTVYYVVMLLENGLLIGAWLTNVWPTRDEPHGIATGVCFTVPAVFVASFAVGLAFMLIYYRYFHVQRLLLDKSGVDVTDVARYGNNGIVQLQHHQQQHHQQQGVFNCRFANNNQYALNRKKKMPTTFVPPPGIVAGSNGAIASTISSVPFWRRPLPSSMVSVNATTPSTTTTTTTASLQETDCNNSVGSRVNIHQKLQEKKQKQLAELKMIEEEIKQGKLVGPETLDADDRQPIPRAKKHLEPHHLLSLASLNNLASYGVNFNRRPPPRRAPRSRTPELLLAPRYLYCDCVAQEPQQQQLQQSLAAVGSNGMPTATPSSSLMMMMTMTNQDQLDNMMMMATGHCGAMDGPLPSMANGNLNSNASSGVGHHQQSSDLESQLSLPRSYTLPREFKYYRRRGGCCPNNDGDGVNNVAMMRPRKPLRNVVVVPSTNSSDGDVDSGDDFDDDDDASSDRYVDNNNDGGNLKFNKFRHETKL